MNLIVVGTNHKYSPVGLREKISFSKNRLKDTLFLLKERSVLKGGVILSTCNRVEIYAVAEDLSSARTEIEDFISRYHEIDGRNFSSYLYIYENEEALRHLFSVTTGLDSLILGEIQILGQVKSSFLEADSIGFVDKFLREVFNCAISFAERIHTETKISEGKPSIGSIAMDFIKEEYGSLRGKNILIIGTGKVTELVLQYLKEERPNVVFISNRNFQKANQLADEIGAKAVKLNDLRQFLNKADMVITATKSPHFIIKKELFDGVLDHQLLILDLAMPRDVDPRIKEINNVDLFYLEDLTTVINRHAERVVLQAKEITIFLGIETEKLWHRLSKSEQEPVLLR